MTAQANTAVALQYTEDLPAPLVIASGRGRLAEAIVAIARQSGVTLVKDPILADSLAYLDVNTFIPESLYEVVAELLAFVRNLDSER
jgi:flagellar biosynthesis protein